MRDLRIARDAAAGLMLFTALGACAPETGEDRASEASVEEICDSTAASGCYAPPPGFALSFTTHVPEAVAVAAEGTAPGEQIRFAVRAEPDAFVYLVVHPDSVGRPEVDEVARAIADSYGVIRQFDDPQLRQIGWAESAYDISGEKVDEDTLGGYVGYAERQGRWYHIILQYPESRRQELRPLLEGIIESWEWVE